MKMEDKNILTIIGDDGKEIKCEILLTFDSDETKRSYIVYTDNTTDEEGNTKVYASIYDPTGKKTKLDPITEEAEWLIIENVLASLQTKQEGEE